MMQERRAAPSQLQATTGVVALIPAKDSALTIAATVRSVQSINGVDRVLVVDDGSSDSTSVVASGAGATVVIMDVNRGKGGAIKAGVSAAPNAEAYLLIDADTGASARHASRLVDSVLQGNADMAIGVLPPAGRKGGFGWIRKLASKGIKRACGLETVAPLSGQRAVRGPLMRSLDLAPRFGLEVGLTIDAVRRGARVTEIPVEMDHHHTGRRLSGFRHRFYQGVDISRTLWPRMTSSALRMTATLSATLLLVGAAFIGGANSAVASIPIDARAKHVVIFGVPGLSLEDLRRHDLPNIAKLQHDGALGATAIRTFSAHATTTEAYATLGAGTRARAAPDDATALLADESFEGGTARQAAQRRTGLVPHGAVILPGAANLQRLNSDKNLTSTPGALGDALRSANMNSAVIGQSRITDSLTGIDMPIAPAAAAAADRAGAVTLGSVSSDLVRPDARFAYGVRADNENIVREFARVRQRAALTIIDSGDLDRVRNSDRSAIPSALELQRNLALRSTDELLGQIVARVDATNTLFILTAVVPQLPDPHVTPTILRGRGIVPNSTLYSGSTQRNGLISLTDIAPTALGALSVPIPEGMIGRSLRQRDTPANLDDLLAIDHRAGLREQMYTPFTNAYTALQAGIYSVALYAILRRRRTPILPRLLRFAVLGVAALPLASLVLLLVPHADDMSLKVSYLVLLAIDSLLVVIASRRRNHPLQAFSWLCGATVLVIVLDIATGATLQMSSLLGYSPYNGARFSGIGNSMFAVLAATATMFAAIHVHYAPRRREALFTAGCVMFVAVVVDGAPTLGSDVGGILSMVPVFAVCLLALGGVRVRARGIALTVATTAAVTALATGLDLLRPAQSRGHLGRLAYMVYNNGWSPLATTVTRKAEANLNSFGSPWVWTLLVVAGFVVVVLGRPDVCAGLIPSGSGLRVAVVGTIAVGAMGFALNDSGVIVLATALVFVGPFVTLLALAQDEGEVMLAPAAISVAHGDVD